MILTLHTQYPCFSKLKSVPRKHISVRLPDTLCGLDKTLEKATWKITYLRKGKINSPAVLLRDSTCLLNETTIGQLK